MSDIGKLRIQVEMTDQQAVSFCSESDWNQSMEQQIVSVLSWQTQIQTEI